MFVCHHFLYWCWCVFLLSGFNVCKVGGVKFFSISNSKFVVRAKMVLGLGLICYCGEVVVMCG